MNKKIFRFLAVGLLGLSQSVNAAPGDVALGVKVGTLGPGLEVTLEATNQVNVRFGVNYFKFGSDIEVDNNDYDLDIKLNSFTALADWYIIDSQFRFTGGAFINNNSLSGLALPSNTYEIGNTIYTNAEVGVLRAEADFKAIAPYIGVGWGNPLTDDSDWSFMFDVGVVFAGKPRIDITSTGGILSNNPLLQADIARAEQDFRDEDDIKYLKYYPVVSVGLNYRF